MDRLSDTPRVNEVVSAWAVHNTPAPQRVKDLTRLARRLERDLREAANLWAAYQRVNAKRGCPDGSCAVPVPRLVDGVRVYPPDQRSPG